jgi:microcystin degradation protein MlrC
MKIAIGSMMHESNSFNKLATGLETFSLADGDEFKQIKHWKGTVIDGIYEALKESGFEIVPTYFARSIPSGPIRLDAYEYIKSRIIDKLRKYGPWDGICLALHGSMFVDGIFDPEGDLLEAIRWEVGHEIPIICTLDMHATVTERMVLLSDGYSVYRTAPHIDEAETGARAVRILLQSIKEKRKTANAYIRIPLLVSGEHSETRVEPAKSLFESLTKYDKLPSILCSSYVMGFPWADNPFSGAGVLVTGWLADIEALKELAKQMSIDFWDRRSEFVLTTEALEPESALKKAIEFNDKPVIISDTGDNPTAGASQDTTRFLRIMIENGAQNALYTCVTDPAAYLECLKHKVDDMFRLDIGACYSGIESERYSVEVRLVKQIEVQGTGYAVLKSRGVTFLVSNKRVATYYPETLRSMGLMPEDFDIIGIKAGCLNPDYQAMSKLCLFALTEGDTSLDFSKLPYKKLTRPMYPLVSDIMFP